MTRLLFTNSEDLEPKEEIGNYSPIALMKVLAKVFGWKINTKLLKWVNLIKALGEEQSGFRKGREDLEQFHVT